MKVLVSTSRTQGQRKNDFHWTSDGELMWTGTQCDTGYPDDGCGCRRSLSGVESSKATTTVEVIERDDIDDTEWANQVLHALRRGGFESVTLRDVRADLKPLVKAADRFPVGTVLECRGGIFNPRRDA